LVFFGLADLVTPLFGAGLVRNVILPLTKDGWNTIKTKSTWLPSGALDSLLTEIQKTTPHRLTEKNPDD